MLPLLLFHRKNFCSRLGPGHGVLKINEKGKRNKDDKSVCLQQRSAQKMQNYKHKSKNMEVKIAEV